MKYHLRISFFLVALSAAATAAPAGEVNWTRFRGPRGAGVSTATTIPVSWTAKDFRWRIVLPAGGHGSPVVWGDRIFLTCAEEDAATRIIVCVKTADGAIAWQRRYESKTHRLNRDNSYASSTPAVDKDHVYVYWTTPEKVTLLALTHEGREVWRRNLGPYTSMHGSGTSPIVHEDLVVIGNFQQGPSSVIALECATGKTRWKLDRKGGRAAYATPYVLKPEGGPAELLFSSSSHGLTSVNPATGSVNWELPDAFPQRVVASPAVASGLVVGTCGQGGRGTRFVAVRPPGTKPGARPELVYQIKRPIPYVPSALAKDGLLFLLTDQGVARCFRAATGEELWQESLEAKFYGSYVWVDGRLYVISRDGQVFVLRAAEEFKLLGRNDLGEPSQATPAVAGGVMYLRTYGHLMAIGGRT
jgi:outer membrane protein assembly factor BamB